MAVIAMLAALVACICAVAMLADAPESPVVRQPVGRLLMVLTDGKGLYVARGAGIDVYDPNVVQRLIVNGPNEVEPNTP